MIQSVLIYTKVPCPYCQRAKQFFTSRNIAFKEIDLTNQFEEMSKLKEKTGHMTFPQIFINDQFVGGYTDLIEKVENGSIKL